MAAVVRRAGLATTAGGSSRHSPPQAAQLQPCDVEAHVAGVHAEHNVAGPSVTPEEALALLRAGNDAFRRGELQTLLLDRLGPQVTPEHRRSLIKAQSPLATVLTCSDSRVPPELLFGGGVGALFVVRNAGNVVSPGSIASLEYGCSLLRTPLLIIMGHQGCTAVGMTVAAVREAGVEVATARLRMGGAAEEVSVASPATPRHIHDLVTRITPAAVDAIQAGEGVCEEEVVEDAILRNAALSRDRIMARSEAIRQLATGQQGATLKVMVAHYHLETGEVQFFEEKGAELAAPTSG